MAENEKIIPKVNRLAFEDLVNAKEWQKIQDNFSSITDVCIRTVDCKGRPITRPSKETRLCKNILKNSPLRDKICGTCLPTFLGGEGIVDKNLSYTCQPGLTNFITPLKLKENIVTGYIIMGPVILVARKSKDYYISVAEKLHLNPEAFWNAISEIRIISFSGEQSLIEFIKDVAEYTLKLAYDNLMQKKVAEMTPEALKSKKLLDVLLDVAFEVSKAQVGSIMFFDKARNELTIRASRGIPQDIVKNARVKRGEGVSGIAAEEGKSFLITETTKDNRIRPYLNRPSLNSSMVLPIKIDDSIWGVLNLGALNSSSIRFDRDNLHLISKLIDLATAALQPQ